MTVQMIVQVARRSTIQELLKLSTSITCRRRRSRPAARTRPVQKVQDRNLRLSPTRSTSQEPLMHSSGRKCGVPRTIQRVDSLVIALRRKPLFATAACNSHRRFCAVPLSPVGWPHGRISRRPLPSHRRPPCRRPPPTAPRVPLRRFDGPRGRSVRRRAPLGRVRSRPGPSPTAGPRPCRARPLACCSAPLPRVRAGLRSRRLFALLEVK